MNEPEQIAEKINQLQQEIDELMYAPVVNSEGEVTTFADWIELNQF